MKPSTEIKEIADKIARSADRVKGRFPHITKNGCWETTPEGDWSSGFWVGMLWLAHILTGDEKFRRWAYEWGRLLEPRKSESTFDLGFLFYPSFALGYGISRDVSLKGTAFDAADKLTTLFSEKAGFVYNEITAGGKRVGRTAIDVMPNLALLWWAYEESGDERYYRVAHRHSLSTIQNFIRDDGSTIHTLDFDLRSGEIVRKITAPGFSDESCWSRGQAWALYGFTVAYRATGEEAFSRAAEKVSGYFIRNLPPDRVPYWDFNDPQIPHTLRDSSAAAIACSGLLTLSELKDAQRLREIADRILSSLSTAYLAEAEGDGVLRHGCFHKPKALGVDEGLIWGDFYFLEALAKVVTGRRRVIP